MFFIISFYLTSLHWKLFLKDASGPLRSDGIFLQVKQRDGQFSKGVIALGDYLNKKGGIYQVVLPTPDSCTLFRPRSTRRTPSRADTRADRDMSFSFLTNDASANRIHYRETPSMEGRYARLGDQVGRLWPQ